MANEPDQQGFITLWPTTLLRRELPGSEAANPILADLIQKMDSQKQDMTTDYLSDNFLALDHPAVKWLGQCIQKTIADYMAHQGADYQLRYQIQGWANVNRFGDYHDLHNHPHSYLSGTYYVDIPEQQQTGQRKDLTPGAISFYDPRPQANMLAIRNDQQVNPEHTIQPKPGMLLLWPAFLHHLVHPNLSQMPRISISFNIVLQWSDDYLPDQ